MINRVILCGASALSVGLLCLTGCQPNDAAARSASATDEPVRVEVLTAAKTTEPRVTTQPATVHAYYQASVYAKISGYLVELKADIGQTVKQGQVLGVISVPDLAQRRAAKIAGLRQTEANQRRVVAEANVSKARVASYQAKLQQSKANVGQSTAALEAARIELQRARDLVSQRAVADRVLDEATKKHAAAAAAQTAAQAAVTSADAELSLAVAQNAAAQADLEVAAAQIDVAKREIDELDALLSYATLVAPYDGTVTARNIEPGDLVRDSQTDSNAHNTPLFSIAQLDRVRIRVAVPERDAPLASPGDAATLTFQAVPKREFVGKIARVAGVLDTQTRSMLVEIDLDNADGVLRPGMFGQARITLTPPANALTLPAQAVRFDEAGNSYVYVIDDTGAIKITPVETGADDGSVIEITKGLTGAERIVGPILRRLAAGQKVAISQ